MIFKLKNYCCKRTDNMEVLDDIQKLNISIKIEFKLYAYFVYLILIYLRHFEFSENLLTDCFGTPVLSFVRINYNHYILFVILIGVVAFQLLARYLLMKFAIKNVPQGKNPKLNSLNDYLWYLVLSYGCTINFGIPGLYAMMYTK